MYPDIAFVTVPYYGLTWAPNEITIYFHFISFVLRHLCSVHGVEALTWHKNVSEKCSKSDI